jgi:predicted ATP-grasp superfamily ATP-dependent carboligase
MKKIFLYEFLCAGGGGNLPPSLRTEGWAMLSALVEDFLKVADLEIWTLLDPHCPTPLGHRCWRAEPGQEVGFFRQLTGQVDATVVIAPECGGILGERSRWVREEGSQLLGCSPEAIAWTGDKKFLGAHLYRHGVPTPPVLDLVFPGFPVVLKPRDGAGSQATFLVEQEKDWSRSWKEARCEMPVSEFLVQPHVRGQAASVAFFLGPSQVIPLPPTAQHLSEDGRFHYLGGRLPLEPTLATRALSLGQRAITCIPGLQGYVGVDLVLGNRSVEDVVIEINPRLTTSYLGLRRLARNNLAEVLWRVWQGDRVPALSWNEGPIFFRSDGS